MGKPRRRNPPEPIFGDGAIGLRLTKDLTAWIDPEDYPLVKDFVWCAAKHGQTFYAKTSRGGHTLYLHDLIMQPPPGLEIDHENGSGLVNFRWNLRVCSHQENMKNSRKTRLIHRMKHEQEELLGEG